MKRPEGFDRRPRQPGPRQPEPGPAARRGAAGGPASEHRPGGGHAVRPGTSSAETPPTPVEPAEEPRRSGRPPADDGDPIAATRALIAEARREERAARRDARRAVRERRSAERGEVRRFTRRSRRRRIGWLTAGGIVAGLALIVVVLVVSPLLALRTVVVEGAQRLDPAAIEAALDPQLGTPLALLDGAAVERELAAFPVIESFVTETVPPSTLVVRIVEREPVLAVASQDGFDLVDPAGVRIETVAERPAGIPQIAVPEDDLTGAVFRNAAAVVESLDDELLARVVRVDATSLDDVTLLLDGVGQTVVWGSPERTAAKAALLRALMGNEDQDVVLQYDVTSPGTGIVRR